MIQYPVKTESDKDAIIEQAKQVCRWIGWLESQDCCCGGADTDVRKMKAMIEAATGAVIDEYT